MITFAFVAALLSAGLLAFHLRKLPPSRFGPVLAARVLSLALILISAAGLKWRQGARPEMGALHLLVDHSQSVMDENSSLKKALANIESWAKAQGIRLNVYAFGSSLEPLRSLAHFFRLKEASQSRIAEALSALDAKVPPGSAVLLLSDGVETGAASPAKTNLAVYPVAMGAGLTGDLELTQIRFPGVIFARGEAPFTLSLRYPSGLRETRRFSLKNKETGEIVWQSTVTLSGISPQEVELVMPVPRVTGPQQWDGVMEPASWERWPENNRASVRTEILREKLRVLYLCGKPSFDYSYLREIIRSRFSRELVSFVILRNPEDQPPYGDTELSLIPFPAQEIFTRSLSEFDLFVLQDFSFSRFALPAAYLDFTSAYVRSGGGLIYLPGPNSQQIQEGQDRFLAQSLGVAIEGPQITGQAAISVADSTLWNQLFSLEPDVQKNLKIWQGIRMPAILFPHRTLKAAKGPWGAPVQLPNWSSVLAQVQMEDGAAEGGRSWPAVQINRVGKGRTAWIGFSGSWQWKSAYGAERQGPDLYDAFWEGLIGWVSGEGTLEQPDFKVYLDRASGGRIKVTARLGGAASADLQAEMLPQGEMLTLTQTAPGSGIYEGFLSRFSGDLTLRVRRDGRVLEAKASLEGTGAGGELRASQDLAYLEMIAQNNQGQMLGFLPEWEAGVPPAASALLKKIHTGASGGGVDDQRASLESWGLVLALILLILEWTWRRLSGLSS